MILSVMSDTTPPRRSAFSSCPSSIYALILAVEALRVANQNAGRACSRPAVHRQRPRAAAGSGAELVPDSGIAEVGFCPTVLVVAGNQPT